MLLYSYFGDLTFNPGQKFCDFVGNHNMTSLLTNGLISITCCCALSKTCLCVGRQYTSNYILYFANNSSQGQFFSPLRSWGNIGFLLAENVCNLLRQIVSYVPYNFLQCQEHNIDPSNLFYFVKQSSTYCTSWILYRYEHIFFYFHKAKLYSTVVS